LIAEEYYANDYPEDEVDSDDEFDRDPYRFRKADSDDEFDLNDEAAWSDDDGQGMKLPWKARDKKDVGSDSD
jgi:hypothetical protein